MPSFTHALYQLLIAPLELAFEMIFGISTMLFHNSGLSILFLSLCMNLLLLPLYRRVDAIQDEEQELEARIEPSVAHIRKTFHGDERFMMLQALYRLNGYKPFYALKGSLPLLLEIPFFIAAYHFLSNLDQLRGAVFGPIADLSMPDGLLTVAGFTVSLLPILMTLINFVSSAIYTRGQSLRSKIQLYGIAVVFLVLLYRSPSGLVLYWTLNNLFSLVKNFIIRHNGARAVLRRLLRIFAPAAGAVLLLLVLVLRLGPARSVGMMALGLVLLLPTLLRCVPKPERLRGLALPGDEHSAALFFSGAVLMTLLTGALIPSAVVADSPEEFFHVINYYSPLVHILNASLLAAGLFLIWFGLFFYLADRRGKQILGLLMWLLSGMAVANYMFFGTKLGLISSQLVFPDGMSFAMREKLLNLAALLGLLVLLTLLWRKRCTLARSACLVIAAAVLGMSVLNAFRIQTAIPDITREVEIPPEQKAHFTLSRNGKNVIILFLDRAVGVFVPYFLQEKPELREKLEGFTYYPNTASFGVYTNFGAPALYGGYEYTPEAMNSRQDKLLVEKHNEALLLMPTLFSRAGYESTLIDPPYPNYTNSDLSMFEAYPEIHAYTAEGQFLYEGNLLMEKYDRTWERNFFCYSLMKTMPVLLQPYLYQNGSYFQGGSSSMDETISYSRSVHVPFQLAYSVLRSLPEIGRISDGEENTFVCLGNLSTHEPTLLQEPAYEPASVVDNRVFDREHPERFLLDGVELHVETRYQMASYQVNMAALLQLGNWFDYLRENGVYDNSRIIIVSDHGFGAGHLDSMYFGLNGGVDAEAFNPLLMVKDFDSREFSTDMRLMTNADTPTLAMEGLIDNPVNPFTGVPIDSSAKEAEELHVFGSRVINLSVNNGTAFLPGPWYAVHDSILDSNNWRELGEY